MDETTIAMIFAGFAVLATLVTWGFYIVAGKSLWDMRNFLTRLPGDRGKGRTGQPHSGGQQQHRPGQEDATGPEQ